MNHLSGVGTRRALSSLATSKGRELGWKVSQQRRVSQGREVAREKKKEETGKIIFFSKVM